MLACHFRKFLLAGLCCSILIGFSQQAQAVTYCDGACGSATIEGDFYDLVLIILAEDGDDIDLTVDGDIYIRGPLATATGGAIELAAGTLIINTEINGTGVGDGGDNSGGIIIINDPGGIIITAGAHAGASLVYDVVGDVYLDVADLELANLRVSATSRIVVGTLPVPEPGSAALLGLGLIGLARRTRSR